MCHRLQDGTQCLEANGHIYQVGSKEEVVDVSQAGHNEVPNDVQIRLQ